MLTLLRGLARPVSPRPSDALFPTLRGRMTAQSLAVTPKFIPVETEKDASNGFRFRLVSYNILAQVYVKSKFFPHSPSPCLRWKARSQAILLVLKSLDADFLCLQELDEFDSFYKKHIEANGYSSIYTKRPGKKRDGCGIFYKSSRAELLWKVEIDYNDLARSAGSSNEINKDAEDDHSTGDPLYRLKRDCVGILAAFRLKSPCHHTIIVGNTHIYWDPEWIDVKLAQSHYLLSRLTQFTEEVSKKFSCAPSVVIAGDFNSTPGDKVYKYLTSGDTSSVQSDGSAQEPLLCSLYASLGGEPPFTNCTPDFTGTLDYIFFSNSGGLKPVSHLEVPGPDSASIVGGLPNFLHPSDHLPIGGDFEIVHH